MWYCLNQREDKHPRPEKAGDELAYRCFEWVSSIGSYMGQQSHTAGHLISLRRHKNTPFTNVFRIISRKPPFVDRYPRISFEFLESATCREPVYQMEKSDKNGQKALYEYHKNGKFDLCN